jgi:hypothetical protein
MPYQLLRRGSLDFSKQKNDPDEVSTVRCRLEHIRISAVAFKEGDAWVVQGIEYDNVAHADDVRAIPHAFMRAVMENIVITEHLGRRPLEGIRPAPHRFKELFETATTEMRATKRDARAPDISVRLAA